MLVLQKRQAFIRLSSQLGICRSKFNFRHFSTTLPCIEGNKKKSIITPWYVNEALKTSKLEAAKTTAELPSLPEQSPQCLPKLVEFIVKDMGLRDVSVINKQTEDQYTSSALGPAIIVLGTVTSSKHLESACMLLKTWIKREYGLNAARDGVLTTNFVKLYNRRQKRRQQRQRIATSSSSSPLQRVGNWVAVDTKLDNIYVHLMTSERRNEVDLEHLHDWDESLDDEIESQRSAGAYVDPNPMERRTKAALGRREYSTSANNLPYDENNILKDHDDQIPESREVLALENLVSEPRNDLSEDSPEVKDFVKFFPEFPTRQDWKNRLKFFAVAIIQSSFMSVDRIVAEAELQQASGYVLDDEDIESVLTAICYHGQSFISTLPQSNDTFWAWKSNCNAKASLICQFYEICMRPLGKSIVANPRLLTLLYRTFVGTFNNSANKSSTASKNNSNMDKFDVLVDLNRSVPLRYLLETTDEIANLQTVSMIMTSLCHKSSFDAFWKITTAAALVGCDPTFSQSLAELAIWLVVRSGDKTQIKHAIMNYLPNCVAKGGVSVSKKIVQSVEKGLELIDSNNENNYGAVKEMLLQHPVNKANRLT